LFYFFVYKSLYSFFSGEYDTGSTEFKYNKDAEIEKFQQNKDNLLTILKQYVGNNQNVKEFIAYSEKEGEKVYKDGKEWIRKIDYTKELETQIISICAAPPFSLYKDIQEFAFYWVLKKLQQVVEEINNEANTQFSTGFHDCKNKPHCDYENFRRWLHLAADLKINYVFSVEMLKAINILFDNWDTNGIARKFAITRHADPPEKSSDIFSSKKDFDIGFLTYYVGIIEQLTKTDEAKAVKVIQNIATLIKEPKTLNPNNPDLTSDKVTSLTLRNNFNNKFIDCLRYLVFENTFIFNTFIDQFYDEEKNELADFCFENDIYNNFFEKIEHYHKERQQARWQSLNLMLSKYEAGKPKQDENLEAAFYKTVYLKILLENDKNGQRIAGETNIKDKTTVILQYLTEILGINEEECKNGGAYFTVRYKDRDKQEKDIAEDDLYTVSQHYVGTEDKLKMPLTDENSITFDLYKGIKEKNSRKPSSLIELIYKDGKYISSSLETYYSNEEIKINEDKIETGCIFDHKYNNLLFLRIADIKEDEKYRKKLEEFIKEISEKNKLPKIFEHYKNAIQEKKIINFQYFSEIADFPLNIREKFMRKLKNAIEKTNDDKEIIKNVKDVLLDFKRKEVYRSYPNAVLAFYKCRLDDKKQCPDYNSGNCGHLHKRFDPKRIRFLLLLRDEIGQFVERHLKNDSFSAYVANEQENDFRLSMTHNEEVYDSIFQKNFDKIKQLIPDISTENKQNVINEFVAASHYLINKTRLIAEFSSKEQTINSESDVKTLIDKFDENWLHILNFDMPTYPYQIDKSLVDFNSEVNIDKNTIILYSDALIDEIVFEIIYNIRKYVIFEQQEKITETDKLKIYFDTKVDNGIIFFGIINNHNVKDKKEEKKRNAIIRSRKQGAKGLNLAYNCLATIKAFNKKNLHIEIVGDLYKVWIPINVK
jgi:hypothetical protein